MLGSGGTSTGIVLWHEHLPADLALREEAIRWIMGVPAAGEIKAAKSAREILDLPTVSRAEAELVAIDFFNGFSSVS